MVDRDPFDVLRQPVIPAQPTDEFAASLRRRLEQELGMNTTTTDGTVVMVHLRVDDPDRAMRFFERVLGWEAERVEYEGHANHYTTNTDVTVRLVGDPASPPVVPNYAVADVGRAVQAIEAAGGVVEASDVRPDGGGWARGRDDQGVPLLVYKPGGYHEGNAPTRAAVGEVGMVFVREDADRARRFYGDVFGWQMEPAHAGSRYFESGTAMGVFDELPPSAVLYFSVPAMRPVLAEVERAGGVAGEAARDMGELFSSVCRDDQGTEFGLISAALD